MKKISVYTIALLFVFALGTVSAAEFNGATDFTGGAYDRFDIGPAGAANSVEAVSAGGLRVEDSGLSNGVTDFSGRSYDTFEINARPMNVVESESAGGMRAGEMHLYNGATDFIGGSYDTFEIGR